MAARKELSPSGTSQSNKVCLSQQGSHLSKGNNFKQSVLHFDPLCQFYFNSTISRPAYDCQELEVSRTAGLHLNRGIRYTTDSQ
jgi:hypothetical protein